MSSSSLYEPEEDEERSDSDTEFKHAASEAPPSSPPIQSLQASSSVESAYQNESESISRASLGNREEAFHDLRRKLTKESLEAYSRVLEGTAGDLVPDPTTIDGESYNVTQNGIVTWNSQEKEVFFNVLDRKGKNGIKEIAEAIGTKTELEVQEHLQLLRKGVERQHMKERHSRAVILGEVPAALEVSQRCCRTLDKYAELLSLDEQYTDDVAGREKHHDAWIIDQEKAEEIDEQIKEQGNDIPHESSVYKCASLFNIKMWPRLSHRFFMNAGGPRLEDNWVNIAFADETPSMTAEAFGGFYALAVSVTRRLIQSSLFFAMSRLRNMRDTGNRKARVVRSRDVKTALDVLNMKRDRSDFWIGLARRCSLEVADLRHKKGWNAVSMDHDDVEDILAGRISIDTVSERSASQLRPESRLQGHTTNDEDMDEDDDDDQSDDSSSTSSMASSSGPTQEEKQQEAEDIHAENEDQKNSALEEQQLWDLLGREPPSDLASLKREEEGDPKATRRPAGARKNKEQLVDWRDRTLYRSDWEEYGNEVFDLYEEMSDNRRKRRRIEEPSSSWDSSEVESWRANNIEELGDSQYLGTDAAHSEQGSEHDFKPAPTNGQSDEMDLVENSDAGQGEEIATSQADYHQDTSMGDYSGLEPDHEPGSVQREAGSDSYSHQDDDYDQIPNQAQKNYESKEEIGESDIEPDTNSHSEASDNDTKPHPDQKEEESEEEADSEDDVKAHPQEQRESREYESEEEVSDSQPESDNDTKPNMDTNHDLDGDYTSHESDDDLAPHQQRPVKYSSSDEEDGSAFYSRPMSPTY